MPPKASRFLLILDGGAAGKVERIDAEESNCVDQIGADLQRFIDVCEPLGQVGFLLSNKAIPRPSHASARSGVRAPAPDRDWRLPHRTGRACRGRVRARREQRQSQVSTRGRGHTPQKLHRNAMKLCKNIAAAKQAPWQDRDSTPALGQKRPTLCRTLCILPRALPRPIQASARFGSSATAFSWAAKDSGGRPSSQKTLPRPSQALARSDVDASARS